MDFATYLRDEAGYADARQLPDGRWLAVQPQGYTCGLFLIADGDRYGYRCRWCYTDAATAFLAASVWDGVGDDPPGPWIKQKGTDSKGRSVDRLNPAEFA